MSKRTKIKFSTLKKYNKWNKNSQDSFKSRMGMTRERESKLEGIWKVIQSEEWVERKTESQGPVGQ